MAREPDLGEVLELVRPITRRPVQAAPAKPLPAPAKPAPPSDETYPGWLRALILFGGIVITYAAIFALTAFALSVMS